MARRRGARLTLMLRVNGVGAPKMWGRHVARGSWVAACCFKSHVPHEPDLALSDKLAQAFQHAI